MVTKYRQIFILSPETLTDVSHFRWTIWTIVTKYSSYSSTENLYHNGKSTPEIIKPKKYDYSVNIMTTVIKKALEIPQNELRKPKEKQIAYVLPYISTLNPNNPPVYKKSLREIIFQDFKTPNLLTVSYNHLT